MARIRVSHRYGASFEVRVRGHRLIVDQPSTHGGDDQGPTPTELFVASLGACVAHYAQAYLLKHGLSTGGVAVESDFHWDEAGTRVAGITLSLRLPADVDEGRREAALRAAMRCAVHRSIQTSPEITIRLAGTAAAAMIPVPGAEEGAAEGAAV